MIVKATAALLVRSAIINGEAIVLDANGISDIGALRSAMRWQPERDVR